MAALLTRMSTVPLGVGPAEALPGAGHDGDLAVEAAHQAASPGAPPDPGPPRSERNALYFGKAGRMAGSSFMILLIGPVTFTFPLARARAMLSSPSQKAWPSSAAIVRVISVGVAGSGFMVMTGGSTVVSIIIEQSGSVYRTRNDVSAATNLGPISGSFVSW